MQHKRSKRRCVSFLFWLCCGETPAVSQRSRGLLAHFNGEKRRRVGRKRSREGESEKKEEIIGLQQRSLQKYILILLRECTYSSHSGPFCFSFGDILLMMAHTVSTEHR